MIMLTTTKMPWPSTAVVVVVFSVVVFFVVVVGVVVVIFFFAVVVVLVASSLAFSGDRAVRSSRAYPSVPAGTLGQVWQEEWKSC